MATQVKTLRLPEDVVETVESFPGGNFTVKFCAAVRLIGSRHAELEEDIKRLKAVKTRLLTDISDLQRVQSKLQQMNRSLEDMQRKLSEYESATSVYLDCVHRIVSD